MIVFHAFWLSAFHSVDPNAQVGSPVVDLMDLDPVELTQQPAAPSPEGRDVFADLQTLEPAILQLHQSSGLTAPPPPPWPPSSLPLSFQVLPYMWLVTILNPQALPPPPHLHLLCIAACTGHVKGRAAKDLVLLISR